MLIDALPYYDQGYEEPGVRDATLALVEEEAKRFRPSKNYLEFLPPVKYDAFETDIMKNEFNRLSMGQQMEVLSMRRYELPQPNVGRMNDISAWQECIDNSNAQLQCQDFRIKNLELMCCFGGETHRQAVEVEKAMVKKMEVRLSEFKKAKQDLNWQRKNEQMDAGARLKSNEETWVGFVSKNYEIELACQQLEGEVAVLKAEFDKANKE